MRDVDYCCSLKDRGGGALENKTGASFPTWRQQRTVKPHFCSLHVVCCTWNSQAIGDAANNEGLCPENPDKRRMRAIYRAERRPETKFLPGRAAGRTLQRFWSQ